MLSKESEHPTPTSSIVPTAILHSVQRCRFRSEVWIRNRSSAIVFFRPQRRMFAADRLSSRSHSVFKQANHVIESNVRTEPMTSTFVPDSTSTSSTGVGSACSVSAGGRATSRILLAQWLVHPVPTFPVTAPTRFAEFFAAGICSGFISEAKNNRHQWRLTWRALQAIPKIQTCSSDFAKQTFPQRRGRQPQGKRQPKRTYQAAWLISLISPSGLCKGPGSPSHLQKRFPLCARKNTLRKARDAPIRQGSTGF